MRAAILITFMLLCSACDSRPSPGRQPAPPAPAFEQRNLVTLTPLAAIKVRELAEVQGLDLGSEGYLRVGAQSAGGGQFRHSVSITRTADPAADYLGESQGVRVVVEKKSAAILQGVVIDYRSSAVSGGFVFTNPNAKAQPFGARP